MWVVLNRRDLATPQYRLMFGRISNKRGGSVGARGMVWAHDRYAPGPNVTTITAPAGLLCDKERHVVVGMVCGVEAARTEDATVVERTVPRAGGLVRSKSETHEVRITYLHRKQLSPFLKIYPQGLPGTGGSLSAAPAKLRRVCTSARVAWSGRLELEFGRKR